MNQISIYTASVALCLLLSLSLPAHGQLRDALPGSGQTPQETVDAITDVNLLLEMAKRSREARNWDNLVIVLKRVVQLRPQIAVFRYRLAAAHALRGDRQGAYELLLQMQQMGLAYAPEKDPDFKAVANTEAWKYIIEGLQKNFETFGQGEVAATVDVEGLLADSISYEPKSRRFLLGDIRNGRIYAVAADGKGKVYTAPPADAPWGGVLGLAADPERKRLWAAVATVPQYVGFDANQGQTALLGFDLGSGKLRERIDLASADGAPALLATVAVSPADGTVYVADLAAPRIFRLKPGSKVLEPFMYDPGLAEIRGLAVTPDGGTLYFADFEHGLFAVDLKTNSVVQFETGDKLNLGGIDSLALWKGHLVFVQNGVSPRRVMRLKLEDQKLRGVQPLEANKPALTLPVGGVVVGDELVFIANSQLGKVGEKGVLLPGATLEPLALYRTPLDIEAVLGPKTITPSQGGQ